MGSNLRLRAAVMHLAKLIAAIENASEGSEYLDYAIQRLFSTSKPVPPYSRSLDAAMLLVPDGWSVYRLSRRHDCRGHFSGWIAELYRARDVVIEHPASRVAPTASLALCAAALRIRLAESGADGGGDVVAGPQRAAQLIGVS